MRYIAVIDIGTFSVRCYVFEMPAGGNLHVCFSEHLSAGLGKNIARSRALHPEAKRKTLRFLERVVRAVRRRFQVMPRAVATHAFRIAVDSSQFAEAIQKKTGVHLEIISEKREGALARKGASDLLSDDDVLIDLGGGSTEWIFKEASGVQVRSFPCGALTLSDPGGTHALSIHQKKQLLDSAARHAGEMVAAVDPASPMRLVFAGGAATTLAAIKYGVCRYHPGCVHGKSLHVKELHDVFHALADRNTAQREKLCGMERGRGNIIVSGCALIYEICEKASVEVMTVSERGVVYGMALEIAEASR